MIRWRSMTRLAVSIMFAVGQRLGTADVVDLADRLRSPEDADEVDERVVERDRLGLGLHPPWGDHHGQPLDELAQDLPADAPVTDDDAGPQRRRRRPRRAGSTRPRGGCAGARTGRRHRHRDRRGRRPGSAPASVAAAAKAVAPSRSRSAKSSTGQRVHQVVGGLLAVQVPGEGSRRRRCPACTGSPGADVVDRDGGSARSRRGPRRPAPWRGRRR